MELEVTEEAVEVLRRSLELANLDPATAGVRLRGSRGLGGGFDVQVEMAEGAAEGEETVHAGGLRIFVDPSIRDVIPNPVLTAEPQHEIVVVRPADPT